MKEDEDVTLSMDSVGLTVGGWINVKDPPTSFEISPDGRLDLADVLDAALNECGLGDRLRDVYLACHKAAEPRFARRIAELEAIRRGVLVEADAAGQIQEILDPTGGVRGGRPNLEPVPGTEGEQHLPYKDSGKRGREKKR